MRNLCWRLGGFGKLRLSASRSLRSVTGTDCFVLSGSTSGRRRGRQVKSSRLGTLTWGRCAEGARSDCIFGGRARAAILARPAAHGGSIRDLRSGRQWPPGALKVVVAGYPVGPEPGAVARRRPTEQTWNTSRSSVVPGATVTRSIMTWRSSQSRRAARKKSIGLKRLARRCG